MKSICKIFFSLIPYFQFCSRFSSSSSPFSSSSWNGIECTCGWIFKWWLVGNGRGNQWKELMEIWRKSTYSYFFPTSSCLSFLFARFLSYWTWLGKHLMYHLIERSLIFAADIDECIASPSVCHVNAQCTNTIGSYRCTCKPGYSGNGTRCTGT